MRKLTIAAAFALSVFGVSAGAQAMPAMGAPGASSSPVTLVAEGCGGGFHRIPNGRCVPNYRRPIVRRCPPGMHLSRSGFCRRNY
jgi:hypothetical protein